MPATHQAGPVPEPVQSASRHQADVQGLVEPAHGEWAPLKQAKSPTHTLLGP